MFPPVSPSSACFLWFLRRDFFSVFSENEKYWRETDLLDPLPSSAVATMAAGRASSRHPSSLSCPSYSPTQDAPLHMGRDRPGDRRRHRRRRVLRHFAMTSRRPGRESPSAIRGRHPPPLLPLIHPRPPLSEIDSSNVPPNLFPSYEMLSSLKSRDLLESQRGGDDRQRLPLSQGGGR